MASKIEVNLDTSINNKISVQCKQNDDLTLQANIFENGIEKDITNYNVIINGRKADYTFVIQNTDIVKENNKMVANLDRDFSRVPGTTKVDITLLKDGKQDTTFEFDLEVVSNVIRGAVEHGNKIPILEELQNTVVEAKETNAEAKQLKLEVTEIKEETEKMIPAASQVKEDLNILIPEATPIRDDLKQLIPEAGEINNLIRQQIAEHKVNEEKREAAEEDRVIKEVSREKAESIRANSENTRKENENLRISSEETRVLSENARVTNEDDRKTKENERLENEKTRVLSETTREENEETRVLNEENRVSKENERIENETNRVKSENARVLSENDRVSKENDREINEQKRVSAEEEREANEIARQTAYKEIQDARVDYFGTEHNNLEERLNEDFDNVHQKINESSLLPYEGTNISASDSYYGLIKDLTIKGKTLQNLVSIKQENYNNLAKTDITISDGIITGNGVSEYRNFFLSKNNLFKPSTKYTIICNVLSNTLNGNCCIVSSATESIFVDETYYIKPEESGIFRHTIVTKDDISTCTISLRSFISNLATSGTIKLKYMILEGDYTNVPLSELPFIEGIQSVGENEVTEDGKYKVSVKSCGKNLLDISKCTYGKRINETTGGIMNPNSYTGDGYTDYIKIDLNVSEQIQFSCDNKPQYTPWACYDENKNYIKGSSGTNTGILPSNTKYIRFTVSSTSANEMLEYGTAPTAFENYKETVVEYLLDKPHMNLPNGVEDIIDEDSALTKRVDKVVLDGTEVWYIYSKEGSDDNYITFYSKVANGKVACNILSDTLCVLKYTELGVTEGVYSGNYGTLGLFITVLKSKLSTEDANGLKAWLAENPVTVYYELAEPVITQLEKTQLFSQDGTTHIFSDNLLPPKISCKIAGNVPAVISYLRLENEALQKENTDLLEQVEENNIINIETSLEQDARLTMLELGVN